MASKRNGPIMMNMSMRGRLAADPILGFATKTGRAYCEVGVAYNSHGMGHPSDRVIFFKFMAYQEMAEVIAQSYSKGDWITIVKSTARADKRLCRKCKEWIGMPHFVIEELDMDDLTKIPEGMEKYLHDYEEREAG